MKPGPEPAWFPLRRQILESSIWEENAAVCKLWITILLIGSEPARHGTVDMTLARLAGRAVMPVEDTAAALAVLMRRDANSRSTNDDGRRLELIAPERDWGWRIVNWERFEQERKSALNTNRQRAKRAAAAGEHGPSPGAAERHKSSRNVTEPADEKEKEKEIEKETERETERERPPLPLSGRVQTATEDDSPRSTGTESESERRSMTRKRERCASEAPPSEAEWMEYCLATFDRWPERDITTSWLYYERRHWKGVEEWNAAARGCYVRWDEEWKAKHAGALVEAHKEPTRKLRKPFWKPRPVLEPAPADGGVWPLVLEALRKSVDERDFDTWFRGTRQTGQMNASLRVVVGTAMFAQYVVPEYAVQVHEACKACGVTVPVEYVVENVEGIEHRPASDAAHLGAAG